MFARLLSATWLRRRRRQRRSSHLLLGGAISASTSSVTLSEGVQGAGTCCRESCQRRQQRGGGSQAVGGTRDERASRVGQQEIKIFAHACTSKLTMLPVEGGTSGRRLVGGALCALQKINISTAAAVFR